jgi:hypothetical protein
MALHKTITSLLKESLPEFLQAAEYCIEFSKGKEWGLAQEGGCLGYPGAAIMFSIADSLGSYHQGRADFIVHVDGNSTSIRTGGYHHLFIFNSEYYGLDLSERTIKKLYDNYRCLLLHNSALAKNHFLVRGKPNGHPFLIDDLRVQVNVVAFLRVTKNAVGAFLTKVDQVVPGSKREQRILAHKR